MGKTMTELHDMLKLHEQTLPSKEVAPALHAIRAGRIQKNQKKKSHKAAKGNQGKGKAKMGYAPVPAPPFAPKPKNPPTPKKDNPAKDAICHTNSEYLYINTTLFQYILVYDSDCGTHICILLKVSREVETEAKSVEASFQFCVCTRMVLLTALRMIIQFSVSKNNLIYFNAILRDDIYEIVLSSSNTNNSSMYAVSNKRVKLNLDSALLWHCRLGHISKKRIEKLQHDGLLGSTDIKSFETCVSCMSEKMGRKPYSYQVERATDLLGLIHTDVCGPFKIMSRHGAYYFVTFTDDFSR
ncbi:zinc finger, CCHC-type containing protein [Tanacetum coccineum]